VGSYPTGASPYGVMDMSGNVQEWVADWYDKNYYAVSPGSNPTGPASGGYKVLRGGSCYCIRRWVRSAYRDWDYPPLWHYYSGFRCGLSSTSSP